LVNQLAEGKATRKELEDKLLYELSSATGSILENDELIKTLEDTKNKTIEIVANIEQSEIIKEDNDRSRN